MSCGSNADEYFTLERARITIQNMVRTEKKMCVIVKTKRGRYIPMVKDNYEETDKNIFTFVEEHNYGMRRES